MRKGKVAKGSWVGGQDCDESRSAIWDVKLAFLRWLLTSESL